jgi:hypothetical protein
MPCSAFWGVAHTAVQFSRVSALSILIWAGGRHLVRLLEIERAYTFRCAGVKVVDTFAQGVAAKAEKEAINKAKAVRVFMTQWGG